MHSATKFISGHSDVMAGVLAVNEPVSRTHSLHRSTVACYKRRPVAVMLLDVR